jgi:hypothetical protein
MTDLIHLPENTQKDQLYLVRAAEIGHFMARRRPLGNGLDP